MKFKELIAILSCLYMGLCSCTSDIEPLESNVDAGYEEFAFALNLAEYGDAIAALDSLESVEVSFEVEKIGAASGTRASGPIAASGTVENLGNKQTLWKYGRGQNLVPRYLCGSSLTEMTVSTVYKITLNLQIDDTYTYEGTKGDYMGWSQTYVGNSQEPWQDSSVSGNTKSFFTFCYDIIATIDGMAPPGGHCWVPYNKDEIKIYVKKFIEA